MSQSVLKNSTAKPTNFRFALLPALQFVTIITLGAGGLWPLLSIALGAIVYLFLDELGADVISSQITKQNGWLEAVLYVIAILTFIEILVFARFAQTHADNLLALFAAAVTVGIHLSLTAGTAGHELVHRTDTPWFRSVGQALFAFSLRFDAPIEHVFGHHRTVGTKQDPATAQRGTHYWAYLPRSVAESFKNAARFEKARLAKKGRAPFHWRNRFLQGLSMSAAFVIIFGIIAGWPGVTAVLFSAMISCIIIELFNYIAHYGLVRIEGTRIAARHSWNSYRTVTTSAMLNLPRHSDHHLHPRAEYWALEPHHDGPILPFGSGIMALAAMFPPMYFSIMQPHLDDWDHRFANADELAALRNDAGNQATYKHAA